VPIVEVHVRFGFGVAAQLDVMPHLPELLAELCAWLGTASIPFESRSGAFWVHIAKLYVMGHCDCCGPQNRSRLPRADRGIRPDRLTSEVTFAYR
jgi:hypothetical protein